ncbi:MAG: PilZ domain-containing protein [Polyangiaceae bacterium]|nr:PilZ domain-containing protein [Polyangiaceae bacterium]
MSERPAAPTSPPASGAERRQHERYELLAQLSMHLEEVDYVLELVNLSHSGAYVLLGSVERPEGLDVGVEVLLSVIHPTSGELVALAGRVVRLQEDLRGLGFGVHFRELDADGQSGLEDLLTLARRQPPPLPGRH